MDDVRGDFRKIVFDAKILVTSLFSHHLFGQILKCPYTLNIYALNIARFDSKINIVS